MQALIKEWIINIGTVIMLSVLLDLILPYNNFKKYTQFFVGIIVITIIIQPIFNAVNKAKDFNNKVIQNESFLNMSELKYQSESADRKQIKKIEKTYKENVEKHIENQIKSLNNYQLVKARVTMNDSIEKNEYRYFIDKIELDISSGDESHIKPVTIVVNAKTSEVPGDNGNAILSQEIDQIKIMLQNMYGVSQNRIIVNIS